MFDLTLESRRPTTPARCGRPSLVAYPRSRTHLALAKDAPESRIVETPEHGRIVVIPQVGGLHQRYQRHAAQVVTSRWRRSLACFRELGAPVAIKAIAAKLARLVYRMLCYGMNYVDQGVEFYEAQYRKLQIKSLKWKAAQLGFQIIQVPAA